MLTDYDRAKYPFLPSAAGYIKELDIDIKELIETPDIIDYAQQRIRESFETANLKIQHDLRKLNTQIASFPVAIMMVAAINDKYLKKRYALHESKKAYEHLKQEKTETILQIAKFFKWNIQTDPQSPHHYTIPFTTYLQNTTTLQDPPWKLINRHLNHGEVHLTQHETIRLLQEEIKKHIEVKLDAKITSLPLEIKTKVERLRNTFTSLKGTIRQEEIPQTIDTEAYPPCIKALYNSLSSGHHLSHIGRFTLTTFLVNIGMPTETILDLYRNLSDFNERLTRYQIEHIAGERGSRQKYQPPKCATLRTHNVCTSPDEHCEKAGTIIRRYKRKLEQK